MYYLLDQGTWDFMLREFPQSPNPHFPLPDPTIARTSLGPHCNLRAWAVDSGLMVYQGSWQGIPPNLPRLTELTYKESIKTAKHLWREPVCELPTVGGNGPFTTQFHWCGHGLPLDLVDIRYTEVRPLGWNDSYDTCAKLYDRKKALFQRKLQAQWSTRPAVYL